MISNNELEKFLLFSNSYFVAFLDRSGEIWDRNAGERKIDIDGRGDREREGEGEK